MGNLKSIIQYFFRISKMGNIWTWIVKTFIPWMDAGHGHDHDKWTHATLTRFSDPTCTTYASHETIELNTCMFFEHEIYVKWVLDMDERMLSRLNFGDDDSCAADSENESYKADYALPEKDAENKCMEPDDNSDVYTITRPPKKVSITTYAGDNQCVADENVMADDTM